MNEDWLFTGLITPTSVFFSAGMSPTLFYLVYTHSSYSKMMLIHREAILTLYSVTLAFFANAWTRVRHSYNRHNIEDFLVLHKHRSKALVWLDHTSLYLFKIAMCFSGRRVCQHIIFGVCISVESSVHSVGMSALQITSSVI